MADAVTAQDSAVLEDQHLRRTMGLWQLTAVGFSGVIGSAWLLGAMYAANAAGPEAIIGWVVGGGALMLIAYVMPSISAAAFTRAADVGVAAVRTIAGVRYLAPAAFVLASLIVYWAGWTNLREALPVLLVGAVVYGYQQCRAGVDWFDVRVGIWLVGYLIAILIVSGIGSKDFGGTGVIRAPWDSVIVAIIGVIAYELGVRGGVRYLAAHPAPEPYQDTPAEG